MAETKDIRNVIFLGHGGAGKTSIVESILHKAGDSNRLGSVDDKSSISDFDEEEKQRGHSIHSTLLNCEFNGKHLNIIDSPGYPDFIGAALGSIPAADTAAVTVSASAGIEVNTRKHYRTAEEAGKARIIIVNKIDSDNIDLAALVSSLKETFGSQCQCANLPAADGKSVIDVIKNDSGDSPVMDAASAHTELLESVIEADDELMEKYLGGEEISTEQIGKVFVQAMLSGTITPILFTDAKDEVGIDELLDFITNYCPSPTDCPAKLLHGEEEKEIVADPSGPLVGLVFKVSFDPRSNMKYASIRLFSGTLKSDTNMIRNEDKKPIRPGHVLKMQGGEPNEIDQGNAGDIVSLAKLEELVTGDLIHDGSFEGRFKMPKIPQPMHSLAIEPASRGDEQKIGAALEKLCEEDPCFKVERDNQTHELVMSGMGDLHLRVMLAKMEHRFKLKVNTKQPKIPYRETIGGKAEGHYRHKKQTGGAGQFGEVYLRVEPAERGSDPTLQFSWDIFGGSIPSQFEGPIVKGINDVMESGIVAGFPMQDVKVSVYDGKHHPVDSKEVAFRAAGKGAFAEAVSKAKPQLLEPIVIMEITVPADNVGDITGDISSRRGRIEGQEMLPGNMIMIRAQVPLSEVTQYDSQLKSVTGGQGSYSMELSHYEPVPPNVQQQIAAANKKQEAEES